MSAIISFTALAKASAFAAALATVAGSSPEVKNQGEYYEVVLTPPQEDALAEFIRRQLNQDPGDVRIDLSGVAMKVIARQYWPWALGLVGVGALLGASGGGFKWLK